MKKTDGSFNNGNVEFEKKLDQSIKLGIFALCACFIGLSAQLFVLVDLWSNDRPVGAFNGLALLVWLIGIQVSIMYFRSVNKIKKSYLHP